MLAIPDNLASFTVNLIDEFYCIKLGKINRKKEGILPEEWAQRT